MNFRLKPLAALLPVIFTFSPVGAQQTVGRNARFEDASTLPSITVYASRFEEKLEDAGQQTQVVSAADIQKSGASNVSEVLSRVAGLPLRTNLDGSTNAVIDMRGYGDTASNNVVVLLDGVRLSENEQAAARTSMIPLEAIDHIEITRGGNSVLYGDGATGGTINIVTKKKMGNLTVVSGGLASYSGFQSGLYHAKELDSSELSVFARQYASDNYRRNSSGSELSAGANWIKHIDPQTNIGIRFFASRERNDLPGALPSIYLNTSPRDTQVPGYRYDSDVDSKSLTFFGQKTIGDIQLAIDLNKRVRRNSDSYRYDAYLVSSYYDASVEEQSYGNSSNRTENQSISPRVKINNFLVSGNALQIGYDWQEASKVGSGFLTFGYGYSDQVDFALAQRKKGLYVRNVFDLSESDRLVVGYRNEKLSQKYLKNGTLAFEADGQANAAEVEYARKFGHDFSGHFRLSQNFRMPNVDDNNNVASSPLDVQLSRDLDLGLNYRTGLSATSISYFRSRIKNEIGYDPSGCSYVNEGITNYYGCNVNYQATRREGIDFRQSTALSETFTLNANIQYVRATFVGGAYIRKNTPGVAPLSGHLSLDYQLKTKGKITLTSRFAASRYASGDYLNDQKKIAGYAVQDISYFHQNKNWSWVASVGNIANKKYADAGIYKPVSAGYLPPYNLTVYPNAGRSFSLTGRYAF